MWQEVIKWEISDPTAQCALTEVFKDPRRVHCNPHNAAPVIERLSEFRPPVVKFCCPTTDRQPHGRHR